MNKVANLLKNPFKNLKHEEQLEIKRLGSSRKMVGNRGQFHRRGLIKNRGLRPAIKERVYFAFAVSYLEVRVRFRLKGIHSRSDTNRTGAEGLSFYYPRLLHCLDQMLAVMSLSQHRVSSSKTVRPRAPCGARCMGHIVSSWSAVCSEVPHSQFGEGARPHLCMDKWNCPTPVRRRLSLTQAARGKPIPTGLTLVPGTKAWSLEALSHYSAFHL